MLPVGADEAPITEHEALEDRGGGLARQPGRPGGRQPQGQLERLERQVVRNRGADRPSPDRYLEFSQRTAKGATSLEVMNSTGGVG